MPVTEDLKRQKSLQNSLDSFDSSLSTPSAPPPLPTPGLAADLKAPPTQEPLPSRPSFMSPNFSKTEALLKQKQALESASATPEAAAAKAQQIADAYAKSHDAALAGLRNNPEYKDAQGRIDSADSAIKDLRELAKSSDDKQTWLKLIEKISHSLIQFAAASYGQKHGVAIEGIKGQSVNWGELSDKSFRDLKMQIDELRDTRDLALANQKQLRSGAVDLGDLQGKAHAHALQKAEEVPVSQLEEQAKMEQLKARELADTQNRNVSAQAIEGRQERTIQDRNERRDQNLATKAQTKTESQIDAEIKATNNLHRLAGKYLGAATSKGKGVAQEMLKSELETLKMDPTTIEKTNGWLGSILMQKPGIDEGALKQLIDGRLQSLEQKKAELQSPASVANSVRTSVPETVKMKHPTDGTIRDVPLKDKEAALAAQYTLVE